MTPKKEEMNADLLAIMAQFGIQQHPAEPIDPRELDDKPQRQLFHAQGVILSLAHPLEERVTKTCMSCGDPFTTNYYPVSYCSVECAERDLREKYKLAWRPSARIKKEKWEVLAEPEIVPYGALRAMKTLITLVEARLDHPIEILDGYESRLSSAKEAEQLKLEDLKESSSVGNHPQTASPQKNLSQIPSNPVQVPSVSTESDDDLSFLFSD